MLIRARYGGVAFFTHDSLSNLNLADDLIHLRLPHLEVYDEGLPVNPWPLGYPVLLAVFSLGGLLDMETGAVILQGAFLLCMIAAVYRLNPSLILLMPLATDSGLWLLGHAWAELLFLVGAFATAASIDSKKPNGLGWAASLALHARQPALPAILSGFLLLRDKRRVFRSLAWAGLAVLIYYGADAMYTHQLFGAPRPPVTHDWGHWIRQAGMALLHELCLVRDTGSALLIGIQLLFALVLATRVQIRSDAARFLLGAGIGYGLFTMACHGLVAFVEDLDVRLLGPATVLIWAGLLKEARISQGQAHGFTLVLLVCGLPLRALLTNTTIQPVPPPTPCIYLPGHLLWRYRIAIR